MRVLIFGGTSGIGWALAKHYLQAGATVAVCGRDVKRVKISEATHSTKLQCHALDIADRHQVAQTIDNFAQDGLHLVIVCAGVYFNSRHHQLDQATTRRMLQTNVTGLSHVLELASVKMLAQESGHLVAISSVAGLVKDYPGASLYSATKRTVLSLCDTYRIALQPFSIAVTAIVPGYVDTEKLRALNAGDASHKPFLMSEEKAVARMVHAIDQRQRQCVFPWQMRVLAALFNWVPRALMDRLRPGRR